MRAKTAMGAAAEGAMPVGAACEVDDLRVVEFGRVGVGRAQQWTDPFSLAYRASADLDVLQRDARHPGYRRLPPQQLFDRARQDVGLFDEQMALVGMLGQIDEEAVQRIRHGVQARDEKEE